MFDDSGSAQGVTIVVAETDHGRRLDVVLSLNLDGQSRNRCQSLIRDGHVRVNGRTIHLVRHKLFHEDLIELSLPAPVSARPQAQDIPLDILYEDDALIVINKPPGLVVHPAPGNHDRTLVNALLHHCGDNFAGIGGERRPGIVHRLDKDTSGVMVVAKTELAHTALAAQFADHGRTGPLERGYFALVWGRPSPPAATIDTQIGRAPHNRLKQTVLPAKGRQAITHFDTIHSWGRQKSAVSAVNCRLETGRTHQIRVHLAHLGHPVLGDRVYGAGFATKAVHLPPKAAEALKTLRRQALHAARLGFAHPVTGETMQFTSPPPPDLAAVIAALGPPDHDIGDANLHIR
ncbi:MAG: RluA family pseudouridine synthase [Alphaproteobacteria bacterium]|nr:RluA family pseudouridine synthase [Alphaproteobacteria bacterium]